MFLDGHGREGGRDIGGYSEKNLSLPGDIATPVTITDQQGNAVPGATVTLIIYTQSH
jgi:hypothetical protein